MDKTQIIRDVIIETRRNTAEVAQPCKQAFDLPPSLIASECPPILTLRLDSINLVRGNHFNAQLVQLLVQRITIISLIPYKAIWLCLSKTGLKSWLNKGDFMRCSTFSVHGDRKTSAVCHCHNLRTFAPLGLSHAEPPFLATTKVPSINPSRRSSLPRSIISSARVFRMVSNSPLLTQLWNRLWQVWYGGYRSGKSCHRAPVFKTQRMPFNTSRLFLQGLPLPSGLRTGSGIKGSRMAHCSSVKFTTTPQHPRFTLLFYHLGYL
jgi:hypothetical protein